MSLAMMINKNSSALSAAKAVGRWASQLHGRVADCSGRAAAVASRPLPPVEVDSKGDVDGQFRWTSRILS